MIVRIKHNNFPKEIYSSKLDNRIILIEKNKIKVPYLMDPLIPFFRLSKKIILMYYYIGLFFNF